MRFEYNLQKPVFSVKNIDILNVRRPKGYKHSYRNGRSKNGFIYTVHGMMSDVFSEERFGTVCVGAGELIFIPKDCSYDGIYLEEGTEIKIVQFDLAEGELPDYLSKPHKIDLPNARELIEDFFRSIQNSTDSHPFHILSCLYAFLWQIDIAHTKLPTKFKRLQPALSEMSLHCEQNEKISHYSMLCDMSEVNFRRLFTEYTGQTPIEYRNNLRLNRARELLHSSEYNVCEVAEFTGFSNTSFFIRLYKKKYGITPKKE